MEITNNNSLNGMLAAQAQVTQTASNLAQVANITGDPATQEVTADFINSIVNQIPQVIAYEANAQGFITQQQVTDSLLDIKA